MSAVIIQIGGGFIEMSGKVVEVTYGYPALLLTDDAGVNQLTDDAGALYLAAD